MPEIDAATANYVTDRKRVSGTGTGGAPTAQHWRVTISSAALVVLAPLFLFTFGSVLGEPYEAVLAYYARPIPAAIAALTILVSMYHFRAGAQVLITDYTRGFTRKASIVAATCLSYAIALIGVFAVIRLAL